MNAQREFNSRWFSGLALACVAAAWFAMPQTVRASDWSVAVSLGHDSTTYCRDEGRQVWIGPEYGYRQVLFEVPAEIVTEKVPQYGSCGNIIGYRYVDRVVRPARREDRTERFVVRAGFYETVYDRVCTPDSHHGIVYRSTHEVPAIRHFVKDRHAKHHRKHHRVLKRGLKRLNRHAQRARHLGHRLGHRRHR